jgi:hypothetical protein
MRTTHEDPIDTALDAYVEWREQSAAVQDTYDRWAHATSGDSASAFLEYTIALDLEEASSLEYAELLERAFPR